MWSKIKIHLFILVHLHTYLAICTSYIIILDSSWLAALVASVSLVCMLCLVTKLLEYNSNNVASQDLCMYKAYFVIPSTTRFDIKHV